MKKDPRYFVHYWQKATCDRMRERYSGSPFNHTASELLRRRGVRVGDVLYGWSYSDAQLLLVGRMEVGRFLSQKGADGLYRHAGDVAWEASDHVLARPSSSTPMCFDRTVPLGIVRKLLFISPDGAIRPAKFVGRGKVDHQTFRGLREITKGSARLLDRLIDSNGEGVKSTRPDLEDDIVKLIDAKRDSASGFQTSPAIRMVVERYAIDRAHRHYERQGFTVHPRGGPFDLECRKGNRILYVEVKGTQTSGAEIILTRNELDFAQKNKMELFVVHSVEVELRGRRCAVIGGVERVVKPWRPRPVDLQPLAFLCSIGSDDG